MLLVLRKRDTISEGTIQDNEKVTGTVCFLNATARIVIPREQFGQSCLHQSKIIDYSPDYLKKKCPAN